MYQIKSIFLWYCWTFQFTKWLYNNCSHSLIQYILSGCCVAGIVVGIQHSTKQVKVSVLLKYSSWRSKGISNTLKISKLKHIFKGFKHFLKKEKKYNVGVWKATWVVQLAHLCQGKTWAETLKEVRELTKLACKAWMFQEEGTGRETVLRQGHI